ncbi:uncharacterized protein LOC113299350 [Papaver somniferum]|uniref:uncharacterized protein LOC113299350 n=1 Tax=Papaver somniferum TaxID=3469 RepID=UPI000E7026ED|nr:uncharacterized protein LOC113299350 [Papaver somniferum]
MAENKLEHILFLRDTAPSLPSPCRVKVASTDGDESSDLELIPSYFFEEDDDSIQLDLIPQFLFVENEGVDSLQGVRVQFEEIAKSYMNVFSKLIQAKIDGVKDFEMLNCFNFFEELCKNPEYLKELFLYHNKLLSMDCFFLHLDNTRCLFDRAYCSWFDRILRAYNASFGEELSQTIMGFSRENNSAWIPDPSIRLPTGLLYATGDTFCERCKRGATADQCLCYGCFAVFIVSTHYSQPYPFNTFTILVDKCFDYRGYVLELAYKLRYHTKFQYLYLIMFVLVGKGDSDVGGKLQDCLLQDGNTITQNCNVQSFDMLLTQIGFYTINFSKVYFFKYIILIAFICVSLPTAEFLRIIFDRGKEIAPVARGSVFDRHISKFYFTSCLIVSKGLIFTDAYDGKSAYELILEFEYHLVMWFGILHVFEFVIDGERCDASQLVTQMPHPDYILWFILILQMARKKEVGSTPELCGQLFLMVASLAHLMTLYKHNPFGGFHTTIYTIPVLLLPLLPQMTHQHVFASWPFITEVYAVTCDIKFTYEVRVYTAVSEQPERLASKSFIPCQILKAEEMLNQLRHLILCKVKIDGGRDQLTSVLGDTVFKDLTRVFAGSLGTGLLAHNQGNYNDCTNKWERTLHLHPTIFVFLTHLTLHVAATVCVVALLSEIRRNLKQQVDLDKSMGHMYEKIPTVEGGSEQDLCAKFIWTLRLSNFKVRAIATDGAFLTQSHEKTLKQKQLALIFILEDKDVLEGKVLSCTWLGEEVPISHLVSVNIVLETIIVLGLFWLSLSIVRVA